MNRVRSHRNWEPLLAAVVVLGTLLGNPSTAHA